MDFIEEARQAIEAWVARNEPQHDHMRWLDKYPDKSWHFVETTWVNEFSAIIADYQNRIGREINATTREKRNSVSQTMQDNWFYLSHKAQTLRGVTTIIQRMSQ